MNAVSVLGGVLVLVYFGSILVGGRTVRGHGLPSGTEFLLFGFVIGPNVLAIVSRSTLTGLEPLTEVFLAWVGLVIGGHYGFAGGERIPRPRLVVGGLFALVTLLTCAAGAFALLFLFSDLRGTKLATVALGIGCVSAETTRYAVRWIKERYSASGPLLGLVGDLAEAADVVPLLGLAVVFALAPPSTHATLQWSAGVSFALTLGLGGVLGATASALADIETREPQRWGLLLGTALLGIGACSKLGLSSITVLFLMGVTLARLSQARVSLRAMLEKTERPVMLPCLVLAGAYVTLPPSIPLVVAAVLALVLRALTKTLLGITVSGRMTGAENASQFVGLAMLSSGVMTATVGLFCALRFQGAIGDTVLFAGVAGAVFGELVGPMALRRELIKAGELTAESASTPHLRPVFASRRPASGGVRGSLADAAAKPRRPLGKH